MAAVKHASIDHLGRPFDTVSQMCEEWGVLPRTFYQRLAAGKPLEAALAGGKRARRAVKAARGSWVDHEGNEFATKQAMCAAWGCNLKTFEWRRAQGWDLARALTSRKR